VCVCVCVCVCVVGFVVLLSLTVAVMKQIHTLFRSHRLLLNTFRTFSFFMEVWKKQLVNFVLWLNMVEN